LWYSKRRRAQNDQDFETWIEGGVCPTLNAFDNTGDSRATVLIIDGRRVDDVRVTTEPVYTLEARMGTGGNNVPIIAVDETILFDADRRVGARVFEDGIAPTLMAFMGTGGNNVPFVAAIPIQDGREMEKKQNGLGIGEPGDPSYTLDQTGAQSVAIPIQGTIIGRQDHNGPQGKGFGDDTDPMYTLDSVSQHGVVTDMQVRRLTPIECERLMGWPDNHTLPRSDGKQNPDTTRYKMCGNGVASPVAQWIGQNLMEIMGGQ
jgi:site-specific DNA-cytosine methylase